VFSGKRDRLQFDYVADVPRAEEKIYPLPVYTELPGLLQNGIARKQRLWVLI
jgi:hypothetical protein